MICICLYEKFRKILVRISRNSVLNFILWDEIESKPISMESLKKKKRRVASLLKLLQQCKKKEKKKRARPSSYTKSGMKAGQRGEKFC